MRHLIRSEFVGNLRLIFPAFSILLITWLVVAQASGQSTSANVEARNLFSLDGEWRFLLAPKANEAEELARVFIEPGFELPTFKTIPVPSNWAMRGFEDPKYINGSEAEGFYLHTFTAPKAQTDQRVLLHFDGVWESAEVWLNGQKLGRHDSGFTGFAFDATMALKPGAENRIAVRVRQRTPTFKLDANDDWGLAGIYRSVWLEFMPRTLWIERVEARTEFDRDYHDADLQLRVLIARDDKGGLRELSPPFEVRAILSTMKGEEVQREIFTGTITGNHNGRDIPMTLHVHAPAQWTAETPNLYNLRVELASNNEVTRTWQDRIGFRDVSTAGGVLRVNGQTVKLRGVCRHDEHPDVGRATRPQDWLQDIQLMKAANINAVRTSHYPPADGFLRLCDELGLYVLDEIPLGFGGERMNDPSYAAGVFLRLHETLARDRNRPSVIIWDMGNEDPLTALHVAALRALKGLDSTRPALMPWRAEEELPPEIDIFAPHYWSAENYDKFAATSRLPVVTTEYSHALGPDDFGGVQQRWDALISHAAGAGGMIWLWADQGLRRPINGRPVLDPMRDKKKYTREGSELVRHSDAGPNEIYDSHGNDGTDGIVNPDRSPQRDYWEAKAVYAPVRVLIDRMPLTVGQPSVAIPVRNDFDFVNLSTISIAWKLFHDADVLASGTTRLEAEPHVTTALVVPTSAIKADALTGGSHYLQLTFLRPDGSEMTHRSVRLDHAPASPPMAEAQQSVHPKIETQGDNLAIIAGPARYEFDTKTGEISSISIAGKKITGSAHPVVWRPATFSERNQLDRREHQHDWDSFMQNARPSLQSWNVTETGADVQITAQSEYREDKDNAFIANLTYHITSTGALQVTLKVEPKLDVPWLPEVGMEFATALQPDRLTWLGQGPLDSLSNKHAATMFGYWSATPTASDAHGTKSDLEWAELTYEGGITLRYKGEAGIRLIPASAATSPGGFRILTNLAGAWTKNGPPERAEWRLEVSEGKSFGGSYEITPVLPAPTR